MSLDLDNVPGLSVQALGHCTTCYGDFDDAIRDVRDEVVRVICERVDAFVPPNLQPFSYSRLIRAALAAAIGAPPEHVAKQALVIEAARTWYAVRPVAPSTTVCEAEALAQLAAAVLALEVSA